MTPNILTSKYVPVELEIARHAFCNCTSLEYVKIPKSVRRITSGAFNGCISLRHVRISANFEDDIKRIFGNGEIKRIEFM